MAQSIERSVISNAGNTSFQTPGYQWSFTVGEPITQHFSNGTTSLTQGFQQPGEMALIISPMSHSGDLLVCGQEAEVIPPIGQQACGEVQMSWVYGDNYNNCGGLVSRIWTISDACGNSTTWGQYYPIIDPVAPTLMGDPITEYYLECGDPLPESPGFSDNCDPNPTVTQNLETINSETSLLHYIATDDCGNSTTLTYTLHFSCCAPPVVLEPVANLVVECGTVTFVPDPVFYDPNWNDLTIEHNVFGFGSNCGSSEAHVWTATNGCGASISVNARVS
ncbi:MAG: hypothetical protein JNM00_01685, partial [Flavobacteriales bacterium]|nr:hypothetical protein [Flavobacteriales bacterium]